MLPQRVVHDGPLGVQLRRREGYIGSTVDHDDQTVPSGNLEQIVDGEEALVVLGRNAVDRLFCTAERNLRVELCAGAVGLFCGPRRATRSCARLGCGRRRRRCRWCPLRSHR